MTFAAQKESVSVSALYDTEITSASENKHRVIMRKSSVSEQVVAVPESISKPDVY